MWSIWTPIRKRGSEIHSWDLIHSCETHINSENLNKYKTSTYLEQFATTIHSPNAGMYMNTKKEERNGAHISCAWKERRHWTSCGWLHHGARKRRESTNRARKQWELRAPRNSFSFVLAFSLLFAHGTIPPVPGCSLRHGLTYYFLFLNAHQIL